MKRIFFILVALMAIYLSPHSENTARQFDRLDNVKGFEYTSLMPNKEPVSAKKMTMNMPMDKIRLVEMVGTKDLGCGRNFRETVSKAIADNGMELMFARDDDRKRNEFYAVWDSDRGVFTHLLLIKYRDAEHCQARLMYLAGELTPKDLSTLFENN